MNQIWDIFTSKKEYNFVLKDKYNRALTNYTTQGDILDPIVSKHLNENGFEPEYPNGKSFATCISHDIDLLFSKSSNLQLVKNAVRLDFKSLSKSIANKYKRVIDSNFDLKNILEIDNKYGVKASYYFLSTTKDNTEDFNYELSEIDSYFSLLSSHGHELGLHGSKLVSTNRKNLNTEKIRLEKHIQKFKGYRSHFLKFEIPTTWNILSEEGLVYDTTFGAASCPGFRNGMCHPFQPFDLDQKKWIDIYEIPLIAMDVSFFRYLNLDFESSFELFKILVQRVKKSKGVFTFLWHNNYVKGDMKKFYERCLQYLNDENTWFATGSEVIEWYKENNYFEKQNDILSKCQS